MKKLLSLFIGTLLLTSCSGLPQETSSVSTSDDNSVDSSTSEVEQKTYKASFFVGEEGSFIPPQYYTYGETITKPEDPTREGYIFSGWYVDTSYTTLFDFDFSYYSSDLVIYAKWDQPLFEYYMYGRLNETDVYTSNIYEQEQYHLGTPKEEDSDVIAALYNFHIIPGDEINVVRIGNDDSKFIYSHKHIGDYQRGYYDVLLYENGISLRFIRNDEWNIQVLYGNDNGNVIGTFTKTSTEGDYVYFELKNFEVTATQRIFISYAWEYNPEFYFGLMCNVDYPVSDNESEWIQVVYVKSGLYPDTSTTVYEFEQSEKYDITICIRTDCTYNDENVKVSFAFSEDE